MNGVQVPGIVAVGSRPDRQAQSCATGAWHRILMSDPDSLLLSNFRFVAFWCVNYNML